MEKELPYKLFVSDDLGCTYHETLGTDMGENPEDFKEAIASVEAVGGRWYIEHEGEIHSYGTFQKSYIEMVLQQKEDAKEEMMVTSDDPMVKRVLEGHGIQVLGTAELLVRMTGKGKEEVGEMLASVPPIGEMTDEDKERIKETLQEHVDNGTIKIHDDTKGEIDGVRNT